MSNNKLRIRAVLERVLLDLLMAHPDGLSTNLAYQLIEQTYRFPESWYRPMPKGAAYEKLDGVDWEALPHEQLRSMVATEPNWKNNLRHTRRDFKDRGWLDPEASRGRWRLTAKGQAVAVARTNPELTPEEQAILAPQLQLQHLEHELVAEAAFVKDESAASLRVPRSILLRRGQPAFRRALIDAYLGKCAVSSCDATAALEAAHIVPASEGGAAVYSNGLLLRADLHTLSDLNLIEFSRHREPSSLPQP